MAHLWKITNEKRKGKLAKCWLAAILSSKAFYRKFRTLTINDINVCQMCDDIEDIIEGRNNDAAYGKCNLYFSSQLVYGAIKIFSYQTSSLEKELIDIEKVLSRKEDNQRNKEKYYKKVIDPLDVLSTHSAQLHEDVNLLPDEFNIEIKLRNKMNDAACLEFGALTEEEISSIHLLDTDISLEMFERTHIRNPNGANGSNIFSESKITLTTTQEFNIDISENQKKMSISPIDSALPVGDKEHQTVFLEKELPEVPILEMESRKSDLLTPQKRQSSKENHMETPSKRRRLRFEDEPNVDKIVTAPIPKPGVVAISEVEIERKLQRKKVIIDKNTKLKHKTIQKWLDNINVCTMPLNTLNVNMPMSEILFKTPATDFTSKHKKKWNNSLSALFHMHTVASSRRKSIPIEYEYEGLLDKSTDLTRVEDRNDKTEDLSELVSILGKTTELSVHTKSAITELEHSSILQKEQYKEKPMYDLEQEVMLPDTVKEVDLTNLEETLELLNIEQVAHCKLKTPKEAKKDYQETFKLYQTCSLTKQELLAMFEIHWRNVELIRFTDVIQPDEYNRNDAACCYIFLLELHKEKKITLEQAIPYDILWIRKYLRDISEDDSVV